MSTFLFLTDTHFGAAPMGYQQQRGYPERLAELTEALAGYVREHAEIECVVHGGDLIDRTDDRCLELAGAMRELPVPFYLCLGNHDLTETDAVARWLKAHPDYFPGGAVDFTVELEDVTLHVAPNQWSAEPPAYFWGREQHPGFLPEQLARLEREAGARRPGRPQVVCTHSPLYPAPPAQTGFEEPFHLPPETFTASLVGLRARHPDIRLFLSGHNHVNCCHAETAFAAVTASAFSEAPFEVKEVRLDAGGLRVRTLTLAARVPFSWTYDFDRTYVQGRARDRGTELSFAGSRQRPAG